MLPKINPTKTRSWNKLKEHYRVMKYRHMVGLFYQDPERFSRFSIRLEDVLGESANQLHPCQKNHSQDLGESHCHV